MDTFDKPNLRDIDRLHTALIEKETEQNNVQLTEFYKYSDLFSKHEGKKISPNHIDNLSKEFAIRFNIYKPINVYDGNELLFVVPQIFIAMNDVSEDYQRFVDNFRTNGVSDIPKYAAEATAGMLVAIIKSQEDVDNRGFSTYGEYVKSLSDDYVSSIEAFRKLKSGTVENTTAVNKTPEASFDFDVDGISWK